MAGLIDLRPGRERGALVLAVVLLARLGEARRGDRASIPGTKKPVFLVIAVVRAQLAE